MEKAFNTVAEAYELLLPFSPERVNRFINENLGLIYNLGTEDFYDDVESLEQRVDDFSWGEEQCIFYLCAAKFAPVQKDQSSEVFKTREAAKAVTASFVDMLCDARLQAGSSGDSLLEDFIAESKDSLNFLVEFYKDVPDTLQIILNRLGNVEQNRIGHLKAALSTQKLLANFMSGGDERTLGPE